MANRAPNPYAGPLYLSVACTLLMVFAVMLLAHSDELREQHESDETTWGCGVIYAKPQFDDSDTGEAYELGKSLFKNQCAQCHNKNMKDNLTGPALGGVTQRWADYPREDLRSWIRNSQEMIAAGHPRALEVWSEWKPTVMQNYPALTDEEIDALLAYIDIQYTGVATVLYKVPAN